MVLFWNLSLWVGVLLPVPGQLVVADNNPFRTPIVGIPERDPVPGYEEAPDDATVLRAMPQVRHGIPGFYEEFRDDVQVVTELLTDKIDPMRFIPLMGPAQLHHRHWKCTVYYAETIELCFPFHLQCKRLLTQVVYIDKDYLDLSPQPKPNVQGKADSDKHGTLWAGPDPEESGR